MRVYTVHMRPGPEQRGGDAVLVKEGFCWPALFFSVLWALAHRMWIEALGFLVVTVAADAAGALLGLDRLSDAALALGIALVIGFVANDLRRRSLGRRGYVEAAIVAATDADAAVRRYFDLSPQSTAPGTAALR